MKKLLALLLGLCSLAAAQTIQTVQSDPAGTVNAGSPILQFNDINGKIWGFVRGSGWTNVGGAAITTGGTNGGLYRDASGNIVASPAGSTGTLCFVSVSGAAPSFGACSGSAATAFSAITTSTNTSATMTLGAGGVMTFTSTGIINANQIYGTDLASLGTGVLKNTTTTGVPFISKVILTEPASTTTITIASGKTFTVSNTLTYTGTDGSSIAFGAGGTVLYNGGALGTPSSGTGTNFTGIPISTGLTGAGTGVVTALAVNVGSAGAPVLFNGAGGTPTSLTLTNGLGLPEAGLSTTDVTTGNATTSKHGLLLKLDGNTSHFLNGNGAWTTPSGGGGTGCIPAGTITQILTDGGDGTCPSSGVTIDGSNNISTAGGISTGVGGSVGGYSAYGQGTATTAPTSSVGFMAPASVTTKFMMKLPAAPTTGFLLNTGTTDPSTLSIVAASGTGNVALTTNALMTSPTIASLSLTGTTSSLGVFLSGTDNSVAGSYQASNGSANAHTIWGSGATTSNTITGFATVPTTGHLIDCTVSSTTCLLHDSGVVTANVIQTTNLGTNVQTFLATPSGANFNSMIAAGGIPVNCNGTCSKTAAYTTVLGDGGGVIIHAASDNNARTFTIDSNANVAYPLYTVLTFVNGINTVTIAITSDTMTLAGTASTGSRTLAVNGVATAVKIGTTSWLISGPGLT